VNLAKKGTTILFSSHILSDVQDVANRIGIINRGSIKKVGTIGELKEKLIQQITVEVLLSGPNENWHQLETLKNASSVTQPQQGIVLVNFEKKTSEEQAVNDVVTAVAKFGIRVRGIWILEPSLDKIYFNYVSEAEN